MLQIKYPVVIGAVFIWIGFVLAISFMEAWLKFRAPGITVPLGLGIGRLVFNALNKVEWLLSVIIIANLLFSGENIFTSSYLPLLISVTIIAVQTFWLLPALDARAELHIQGLEVPHSNLHYYFVGVELIKIISLGIFGYTLLK